MKKQLLNTAVWFLILTTTLTGCGIKNNATIDATVNGNITENSTEESSSEEPGGQIADEGPLSETTLLTKASDMLHDATMLETVDTINMTSAVQAGPDDLTVEAPIKNTIQTTLDVHDLEMYKSIETSTDFMGEPVTSHMQQYVVFENDAIVMYENFENNEKWVKSSTTLPNLPWGKLAPYTIIQENLDKFNLEKEDESYVWEGIISGNDIHLEDFTSVIESGLVEKYNLGDALYTVRAAIFSDGSPNYVEIQSTGPVEYVLDETMETGSATFVYDLYIKTMYTGFNNTKKISVPDSVIDNAIEYPELDEFGYPKDIQFDENGMFITEEEESAI